MAGLTFDDHDDSDHFGDEYGGDVDDYDDGFHDLINRSLEMRELRSKRKGAKVSISSVVTEMTQFSEEV